MALNTPLSIVEDFRISRTTRLGHVQLTIASLDRQIPFYTQVLGFKLHSRKDAEAALGTEAEVLLRLTEIPGARRTQRTTGMYHFAILYPSRKELARAIARLFAGEELSHGRCGIGRSTEPRNCLQYLARGRRAATAA